MPLALRLPFLRLFGPPRPRRLDLQGAFELTGERVLLRPLALDDAEALFLCASDPAVTRFLPWQPAPDLETMRSFLIDQIARRRRGESLGMAIVLRETGMPIGSIDLMGLRGPEAGRAELGYLMARTWWGQGLMTEAATLARNHAFGSLGVERLVAYADIDNRASCRVLEKIGMERTGDELRTVKDEERRYAAYAVQRPALP